MPSAPFRCFGLLRYESEVWSDWENDWLPSPETDRREDALDADRINDDCLGGKIAGLSLEDCGWCIGKGCLGFRKDYVKGRRLACLRM